MNYSLGRDVLQADRVHISRCRRCQRTLRKLEDAICSELPDAALPMQGPISLRPDSSSPDSGDAAASDHRYAW